LEALLAWALEPADFALLPFLAACASYSEFSLFFASSLLYSSDPALAFWFCPYFEPDFLKLAPLAPYSFEFP